MVEIIGITRATRGKRTKSGNFPLAYCDVQLQGILLKGCTLYRMPNDTITIWPPNLTSEADNRRGVRIINGDLRKEITQAAIVAFKAVGGTDDELQPT